MERPEQNHPVYEILGFGKRAVGIYTDIFSVGHYNSNLFTVFRGLIQDFTLPGALILLFATGVLADRVYYSVRKGKIYTIGILAGIYSFLLWSPVISLSGYPLDSTDHNI